MVYRTNIHQEETETMSTQNNDLEFESDECEPLPFFVGQEAPNIVFEGNWGDEIESLDDEFDLLTLTVPAVEAWPDEDDEATVVIEWEGEESDTDTVNWDGEESTGTQT